MGRERFVPGYKRGRPTIGVLAGWQVYEGALDGFLGPLLRGIRAAAQDCNLLFACGVGRRTGEAINPAWPVIIPYTDFVPVGPWNTDGLIAVLPLQAEARSRYIQQLKATGHPVIFVGTGEGTPAVVPDNEDGIHQAMAHLMAHGHRRIAFIAGLPKDMDDSGIRLQAYQSIVQRYGLDADPQLIAYGRHNRDGGRIAMQQILDGGVTFTAVLASNDDSAIGAMHLLIESGRQVPEEVAVISFDDRLTARTQTPPLTSVHYPIFETGYQALKLMLKHIDGEVTNSEIARIPLRLVVRESCGCQPGETIGPSLSVPLALEVNPPQPGEPGGRPGPALSGAAPVKSVEAVQILIRAMSELVLGESRQLSSDDIHWHCRCLVEGFVMSLQESEPTRFQGALKKVLRQAESVDEDVHIWEAALSVLHGGLPLLAQVDGLGMTDHQSEALLRQAQIIITESARRQYSSYRLRQAYVGDQLGWMTDRLLAALDETQILATLAEYSPGVGIQGAKVVFFEPAKDDLVAGGVILEGETRHFATRDFPPPGLYAPTERFHLALLPLIVEEEALGFVAFDATNLVPCATVVRQLAAALKSTRLYRLKSRFLSTVSHELRTPLNLIVGLSEILLREQSESSQLYREDVERIHDSAQHLSGLIRDVLDLSSSEAGRLRLAREPLDLRQVLEVVMKTGEQLTRDKGLAWRSTIPEWLPRVWGDRTRLRQVALNLVSNAIKFTEQGTVTLEVKRIDDIREIADLGFLIADWKHQQSEIRNQQWVLVSVSDTGPGIPLEEQRAIFDEFRQSERTTARGYGGMGLGLAICKRLIELHGGEIGVYSSGAEGDGSTFYFTLPLRNEDVAPTGEGLRSQVVLLLVEQAGEGEQLREHLKRQGFEVEVRQLTREGDWLPQVMELAPGAVILELGAASERGWDILKVLKEHPDTRDLPVLFYSLAQEHNSGAVLEMDYLMKPVEAADLTRALARQGLEAGDEAEKKSILIVDDEPGILDMHVRMVQMQAPDYRVVKAKNGREALSALERERVDLVLLDLMMPELDGFGVLETMRERTGMRDVPVVVLTAQVLSEDDMARLNRGVVTVLGKGVFNIDETLGHIEAALERNRKLGSEAQRLVRKAMAHVHEHYAEALTRETLARYVGVSEDYLTRCFRQELGVTPMAYLNRYRVSRAKELLVAGRKSMTEVAMAVGFSDSNYFGRVFRREVGISPSDYRRQGGEASV
jgi:signal transduction histidine kinase/AraC-like DNA-binding protein